MKLFIDLFSSDSGLLSAAVIAFMLGMGVWFIRFFQHNMKEDARRNNS